MSGMRRSYALGVAAAWLAMACQSSAPGHAPTPGVNAGGAAATGGSGGSAGGALAPLALPLPLYRLTNAEYDRSVRDLLKLDAGQLAMAPSSGFPVDGVVEKYAVGDTVSALS